MTKSLISSCIELLKDDEIQHELNEITRPLVAYILSQFAPYFYLSLTLVIVCFLLTLATFIMLVRYTSKSPKFV